MTHVDVVNNITARNCNFCVICQYRINPHIPRVKLPASNRSRNGFVNPIKIISRIGNPWQPVFLFAEFLSWELTPVFNRGKPGFILERRLAVYKVAAIPTRHSACVLWQPAMLDRIIRAVGQAIWPLCKMFAQHVSSAAHQRDHKTSYLFISRKEHHETLATDNRNAFRPGLERLRKERNCRGAACCDRTGWRCSNNRRRPGPVNPRSCRRDWRDRLDRFDGFDRHHGRYRSDW